MPRPFRLKTNFSIYHVMIRCVDGILLFKDDEDKDQFLLRLKKYKKRYGFKLYAFCLMDNHAHMIIDASGADISRVMHGLNLSYAKYYNRKYGRRGHVFGDRFRSEIIDDDNYILQASKYIHKNPRKLKKWSNKVFQYPYSSAPIYMGDVNDRFEILDCDFILKLYSKEDKKKAIKEYLDFMLVPNSKDEEEQLEAEYGFINQKCEYKSEKSIIAKDIGPDDVIAFIGEYIGEDKNKIKMKYVRDITEAKAISMLLMVRFCDYKIKTVCGYFGNITQSRVSSLCSLGVELLFNDEKYKYVINDFLKVCG
ncbi:transposase [Dethiothermospora halolimnae]|uniref:transposase n=1 Tax=Dethiothermospora halolimnae TaxID=3114390 RepID=UPI003CCC3C8A